MGQEPTLDVYVTAAELDEALLKDVANGLGGDAKSLSSIWLYDDRGSDLFDAITRLPEYYLTRAERRLLDEHAGEIAAHSGADTIVELGAGTCEKTRLLLDAFACADLLERFVPFDVSDTTLWRAAETIALEYPGLAVHAIVGDFQRHLDRLPRDGTRMVVLLGSTIGNFSPAERSRFFSTLSQSLSRGDTLLLGVDLVKDPAVLLAAYDDAEGVSAEFQLNLLQVLNARLGASFDSRQFSRVVTWNEAGACVEKRLRSLCHQRVPIKALGIEVELGDGEEILTEVSAKFTELGLSAELASAGLGVEAVWRDVEGYALLLASKS
jgi:L-histidine Nalpha-methyltransferase